MKTDQFITISQLANFLGISRVAVYKKIKKGEIEASKIGNIYLIPKYYISGISGRALSARAKNIIDMAFSNSCSSLASR